MMGTILTGSKEKSSTLSSGVYVFCVRQTKGIRFLKKQSITPILLKIFAFLLTFLPLRIKKDKKNQTPQKMI
jgi:hypothetical protein